MLDFRGLVLIAQGIMMGAQGRAICAQGHLVVFGSQDPVKGAH